MLTHLLEGVIEIARRSFQRGTSWTQIKFCGPGRDQSLFGMPRKRRHLALNGAPDPGADFRL